MPTLYTSCPQCDRPLALVPERHAPFVLCPCCDRRIDVHPPRLRDAPPEVWLAAAALVLAPVASAVGVLVADDSAAAFPWALAVSVVFAVPAAGLVRGMRLAWHALLALALGLAGLAVLSVALAAFLFVVAMLFGLSLAPVIGAAVPAVGCAAVLLAALLSRRCRGWCDVGV